MKSFHDSDCPPPNLLAVILFQQFKSRFWHYCDTNCMRYTIVGLQIEDICLILKHNQPIH